MSEKLKPCPFCGGEAKLCHGNAAPFWYITCTKCSYYTLDFQDKDEGISAWNTRHNNKTVEEMTYNETWELVSHRFKHYKGGMYKTIGVAIHTETGENLILYMPCGCPIENLKIYARPISMWFDEVKPGVKRFERIKE